MKTPDPRDLIVFIEALAKESGRIITSYYADDTFGAEFKADSSPVTKADREAEALMREMIRNAYPGHGIIGEEYGSENESAAFVWVLDPIDGTVSFVHGCPLFGTLIGLLHKGRPLLGAIHIPILNQLCIGDNRECTVNGRVVQVRDTGELAEALVLSTDIENINQYQSKEGFERLVLRTRLFRTWGDCYGYLLVASGKADIMLDPIMNPWDLLPLIPVVQGAGGVITTWSGTNAQQGTSCVAANRTLHPTVIKLLNW
jgi:histidinol phosphatase-like enzyme (inositol monophosphatase family)